MAGFTEDPEWRARIAQDVQSLLGRLSGHVLDNAQRGVPVDTGELHDSLRQSTEGNTARIGSDLNYALYVEEGHRVAYREWITIDNAEGVEVSGPYGPKVFTGDVVPPQPYLRPALYALEAEAGAVIEEFR